MFGITENDELPQWWRPDAGQLPGTRVASLTGDHDPALRLGMRVNLAGKAADTSIGSAAIAHVALALPVLDWDCNITNQYLTDDVVRNPVAVVDGHIVTPEGPGLGIAVDEKLARYRRG